MPRYVLKGSDLGALCIAEAPDEHSATLWAYRHLAKLPGFSGVEAEDAYLARTRGALAESFVNRYMSEGETEETARKMAETACGDRPKLRVVQVPKQDPMEVTR